MFQTCIRHRSSRRCVRIPCSCKQFNMRSSDARRVWIFDFCERFAAPGLGRSSHQALGKRTPTQALQTRSKRRQTKSRPIRPGVPKLSASIKQHVDAPGEAHVETMDPYTPQIGRVGGSWDDDCNCAPHHSGQEIVHLPHSTPNEK